MRSSHIKSKKKATKRSLRMAIDDPPLPNSKRAKHCIHPSPNHYNTYMNRGHNNMPWRIQSHPSNPHIPIYVLSEDENDTQNTNNINTESESESPSINQLIEPIVDSKGYMQFTPNLLICNKYKMIRQLGKGTFSRVFEVKNVQSNNKLRKRINNNNSYAVKVIRNIYKYQLAAQTELAILRKIKLNDPQNISNCIHIIENSEYRGHPIFIFPLLSRSIYSFMVYNGYKPFTYNDIISIMYQICVGVSYIHSLNIIITDLKPENIVLVNDTTTLSHSEYCSPISTQIKLIDFGSAVIDDENNSRHSHLIQTRHYRAPEVVMRLLWTYSADIWSIGCILVELIYGKMLFNTHDSIDHLNQMVKCIDPPPSNLLEKIDDTTWNEYFDSRGALNMYKAKISPIQCKKLEYYFKDQTNHKCKLLYDLCKKMLCWNPNDRITAKNALKHKIFHNYKTNYNKK